ncbi:MAG: hypothetical protein D6732_28060 [Methanobacteriota archaeon]|nr:MAG: hypothetical protein D6732_28060 [Euryarchaeota archaeon]
MKTICKKYFPYFFSILGIFILVSFIPTEWFKLDLVKDPNVVWLEWELTYRFKMVIAIIIGGVIGAFSGIDISRYKSLLMNEEEISKTHAGWKWMLFNDLFVLELFLFFFISGTLYIRILQEDQENIQVELLRLIDITYPLWYVFGLIVGRSLLGKFR